MNAVVFYSNTEQSKSVASYFASAFDYPLLDIEISSANRFKNLVLVFPVHCQNIPYIVKAFLKKVTIAYLTVIATYGKICPGNVLYEIQNSYNHNIVAAAYVPAKHAYIEKDNAFCDYIKLIAVIEKIRNPSTVKLPKLYKNPLANIFPRLRSRLALKITKNTNCCGCNICAKHCSFDAIRLGITNHNCIRCLRCVNICPCQALEVRVGVPLKLYLHKKKTDKIIIYV